MSLSIMTNQLVIGARRNMEQTTNRLNSAIQKLASGSRIVRASDDPAGLAISDSLNATIRSLGQAMRNAHDGISLVQVFEGGTNEINNMLMRVRELSMQSASDTVGNGERVMLDNEVQQLIQEVDRVAKTTKFGGTHLLSGESIALEFQVGTGNNPEADRIMFSPGDSNLTADALGVFGLNVREKENAQNSLDVLDNAITRVNEIRARVGASQNRLYSTVQAQLVYQENLMAAKGQIRDADIAEETSNVARESILMQAGAAVLAQANSVPKLALQLLRDL